MMIIFTFLMLEAANRIKTRIPDRDPFPGGRFLTKTRRACDVINSLQSLKVKTGLRNVYTISVDLDTSESGVRRLLSIYINEK